MDMVLISQQLHYIFKSQYKSMDNIKGLGQMHLNLRTFMLVRISGFS